MSWRGRIIGSNPYVGLDNLGHKPKSIIKREKAKGEGSDFRDPRVRSERVQKRRTHREREKKKEGERK